MKFSLTYNTSNPLVGFCMGDTIVFVTEGIGEFVFNWFSISFLGMRFSMWSKK